MANVKSLTTMDYVSLVVLSVLSCLLGLYHMLTTKRYNVREFLMKNPKLNVLSLILSIAASDLSGASFLGLPREVYMNGVIFATKNITQLFVIPIGMYVFLPLIFKLGYSSMFQYFEHRFNAVVRRCASFFYIVYMTMKTSIEIFVPSLILHQVTGIHTWIFVGATGLLCITYTAFGGFKAIIWADAVQAVVLFSVLLLTIIIGTRDVGGFSEVWKRNEIGKRTDFFIFTSSQYTPLTTWAVFLGNTFSLIPYYSVNQMFIQRLLSNESLTSTKITFAGGVFLGTILGLMSSFIGLLAYSLFHECDPLLNGEITYRDQISVLVAIKVLSGIDGLTGVFIGTVLVAALSTMSSTLNSTVTVTVEDFIIPLNPNIKNKTLLTLSKILTVAFGVLSILFVYIIQVVDNIYMILYAIASSTMSPVFFLFLCGMALPWIKTMPAIIGMLSGMAFILSASVGNMLYAKILPTAPLSTVGCNVNSTLLNTTTLVNSTSSLNIDEDSVFVSIPPLYLMSYLWYTLCCVGIGFLMAVLMTLIFGAQSPDDVDPQLIFPFVIKMCHHLPKRIRKILLFKSVTPQQEDAAKCEMLPVSAENAQTS